MPNMANFKFDRTTGAQKAFNYLNSKPTCAQYSLKNAYLNPVNDMFGRRFDLSRRGRE